MPEYLPVPVEAAQYIAQKFDKSIVIISAWDPIHGLLHTTTYGVTPADKESAAIGGEIACKALGGLREASTNFEDFRLDQAKKLLAALKSAIKIAGEAFDRYEPPEIDGTGIADILAGLAGFGRGRPDTDAIHEAVKTAEEFLG